MNRQILIFGNGQIGQALAAELGARARVVPRAQCDFVLASPEDFAAILKQYRPKLVLNAVAFTAVDAAEAEEHIALALRVNSEAVGFLASACKAADAVLVHFSTDYVFDGSGTTPWQETDTTQPVNYYGFTKWQGEQHIRETGGDALIFRISWVYDETGQNFLNTMLRLGASRAEISVVADQYGAPCYAADIARATVQAVAAAMAMEHFPSGVYHMCHAGETTWHGFAQEIFACARARGVVLNISRLQAITTHEYPTPAKRPLNSRLNCEKLQEIFGVKLPDWREGLARCMDRKYGH